MSTPARSITRRNVDVAALKSESNAVTGLVTEPTSVPAAFSAAKAFLAGTATPTALAALRGERQSPPLVGALAERLDADAVTVIPDIGARPSGKVYDHFVDPPVAVGLMSGATMDLRTSAPSGTTVKDSARAWRTAPPTLASVEAERSRSIAARLVITEPGAVATARRGAGTVVGAVDVPVTALAHGAPAIVARAGAAGADQLAAFTAGLTPRRRAARGAAGAMLAPGQIVVLKLPNASADAAPNGDRPRLAVSGAPARVVLLGHGGVLLADRVLGTAPAGRRVAAEGERSLEIARGVERIVAVGRGAPNGDGPDAGLLGWHAGMQLPYAGWSTALAPGSVVRASGEPLAAHRERLEAGWVAGAELARGVSTVTTTFADPPTTVVIVLDDPAAFGDAVGGRQLLLGLDGAVRARDAADRERPPVLLTMESRSVLAYDIVPERNRPVVVTIASEEGWSLVGVMGSGRLTAAGAIALISSRGLDAAMRPFATSSPDASGVSRLEWLGPARTPEERRQAKVLAAGRLPPEPSKPATPTRAKAKRKRKPRGRR